MLIVIHHFYWHKKELSSTHLNEIGCDLCKGKIVNPFNSFLNKNFFYIECFSKRNFFNERGLYLPLLFKLCEYISSHKNSVKVEIELYSFVV